MPPRGRARTPRRTRRPAREPEWVGLTDAELLEWRLCDLGLRLEDTALADRVERLHAELGRRGLVFRPYVWLSTDWFTPDGLAGFAVPFYLAHTRLARLERRMVFAVEGGTRDACMRLLRHETGHAISNAYGLHRRKSWRQQFGRVSDPYRDTYAPKPRSRDFVLNLDNWYAQSHPIEDFAETFAEWLRPGWRARYAGWPALEKLEYVDEVMRSIARARPRIGRYEKPESLPRTRRTLADHYAEKRARYGDEFDVADDGELRRLFVHGPAYAGRRRAAAFLRESRASLRRRVARLTAQPAYVVDQVLNEMIDTCLVLDLRLARSERETRVDAAILLTARIMATLHGGYPRYAR